LEANEGAQVLLNEDPSVASSLVRVVTNGRDGATWDLIPLRGVPTSPGFLPILHARPHIARSLEHALLGWHLTARQGQVLDLAARALTNAAIGETLDIGRGTVDCHLSAFFHGVGVDSQATQITKLLDP